MAQKGRDAWGSLAEVSPGTWRIRYWAEGEDGYRRRSATVRGTRKEAEAERAALMLAHGPDAPCPTVRECWERWYLPDLERQVADGERAEQTAGQYKSRWRVHIEPRWGDVPADEVRPLQVQQWITSMPYSVADSASQLLGRVLDYAVRYEAIAANPMDTRYVMPGKSTSKSRDAGTWDAEGLLRLWGEVRGHWFEGPFIAMAFGAARCSESGGIRSDGVELVRVDVGGQAVSCAVVALDHQVRDGGRGATDRMKNRWSSRTTVIPGAPGERIAQLAAEARERGSAWLVDDGLGGADAVGKSALKGAWADLMARTSGERHLMKNLRPSCETVMRWTLRLPPWVTERLMGHVAASGGMVTALHYDKPRADDLVRAVAEAYAARPWAEVAPQGRSDG